MDANTTAYLLIAIVIGVIVLEEGLRRFGVIFKRKKQLQNHRLFHIK